jgi:hypothetical protein
MQTAMTDPVRTSRARTATRGGRRRVPLSQARQAHEDLRAAALRESSSWIRRASRCTRPT